jgi:hypothetical protein
MAGSYSNVYRKPHLDQDTSIPLEIQDTSSPSRGYHPNLPQRIITYKSQLKLVSFLSITVSKLKLLLIST